MYDAFERQLKEFLRTIRRKPGRFLALLAIVALGAGFYAGLRMTAPDMKIALDRYLRSTRTYDVRVVCTMGLDDDDLEALARAPGIEAVMGAVRPMRSRMTGNDLHDARSIAAPRGTHRRAKTA